MEPIKIKRFGFAFGIAGVLLYIDSILVMITIGHQNTVHFFNSFLHGLDTLSIIRMQVPWWKVLIDITETFIISWLLGTVIALVYCVSKK